MKKKKSNYPECRDFLFQNSGIHLTHSRYLSFLGEIDVLWAKRYNGGKKDNRIDTDSFFKELLYLLTIHETSFFRHGDQFDLLMQIFPKLLQHTCYQRRLRIWSAGCSCGQELYSIAMAILVYIERYITFDRRKNYSKENSKKRRRTDWIQLHGTDISAVSIDKCTIGEYALNRFNNSISPKYQKMVNNYFHNNDNKLIAKMNIKYLTHFETHNLLDSSYPLKNDIIFCRNVLIYFKEDLRKSVIKKIINSLNIGGYLFLGPSEGSTIDEENIKPIFFGNCVCYRKE